MTLPVDLVLVRHGQSEGNAAKRLSEAGNDSAYTDEFLVRHSASFRLTDKGREQARQAGEFLRNEFFKDGQRFFDGYYTSDYLRAMETAGLLGLPGAEWFRDPYLTERDWGELDIYPESQRRERFAEELRRRDIEPFFWRPPNGESFLGLSRRVDRVLDTMHRTVSKEPKLFVCHGEVMRGFEVRLQRISQERFRELVFSDRSEDRIYNCQIVHYTRRDPSNKEAEPLPYLGWVRWIRPTETPVRVSDWQKIVRPRYSNEDLLEIVSRTRAMIT